MVTTAIVFDHRSRTVKGNPGPLEIRITNERRRVYISTGIKVLASEWRLNAVVNRPDSPELNERLRILLAKVNTEVNRALAQNQPIDATSIRQRISALEISTSPVFLDWCSEQIDTLTVSEGTRKHYITLLTRLYEYNQIRTWSDITVEAILEWDAYLHSLAKKRTKNEVASATPARLLSDAGVYSYHKNLKSLLNRAYMIGKIPQNPYDRLKGRFSRGESESIEYLTEVEMKAIEKAKFPKGSQLDISRDVFVFQMYTGLSYTDAMRFAIEDYKLINGRWICQQERVKTGVPFVNQLLPPAVRVLEKYGMKVPYIINQHYNSSLKLIGEACGIHVNMHSHLARHTFATFMLRNGVKIENLARMLGHTNITQTQRYAKVLALSVHEEFEKIAKKLK